MTDNLERDDNYEPAVLPSPGELLHWGDLHSPPPPPPVGGSEDGDFTRFLPKRQTWRFVVASVATLVLFLGVGAALAISVSASGPKGIGGFFLGFFVVVVGATGVAWFWRWAGRRRGGLPLH